MHPPLNQHYDVVLVGGGIIGSAVAYWLAANDDFDGSIVVIEKDTSYTYGATGRSVSSIRLQFSTPLNIQIARFGVHFIKQAGTYLRVDDDTPNLSFTEGGYLFLATSAQGREVLRQNHQIQREQGVEEVIMLHPHDLRQRFPWLNVRGVTGATLGVCNEGWFDAYLMLQAFKRKARRLGVHYLDDTVVDLAVAGNKVWKVVLKTGPAIGCGCVVNAAGAWAQQVAAMAGIDLPVFPRRRQVFVFSCRTQLPKCPLVIDPDGFYFRPEGAQYLCGMKPPPDQDPDGFNFAVDYDWFEERLWPRLTRWVPAFDAVKRQRAWAGHYAYNTFDRNALLGRHPAVDNLFFATGFSGHGVQQAPAVGRGLSELITYGGYRTLDLSAFSITRLIDNRPVLEQYVV